jgi:hypothetical protein
MIKSATDTICNIIKEPIMLLNIGTLTITNLSDIEIMVKILFYLISIVATILLSIKYIKELKNKKNGE